MSRGVDRSITLVAAFAAAALVATAGPVAATHDDPGSPDDPLYAEQWGPQQVRAEEAWHTATGERTTIAIIDSGIDLDHPDLSGNTRPGATFIAACEDGPPPGDPPGQEGRERSCGNGDWESGEDDGDPHGTHVAGIAGAVTDNGIGIVGIAPDADLLAVKVLDSSGSGSFDDVAAGIRFAVDRGADVINLSLGAPPGVQALVITGVLDQVLEAIEYANANGVVVVAAAGNEAFPICDEPGFDPGVVCVGSTDRREVKSWFGNFPNKPDMLGVSAPGGAGVFVVCGEEVLSTVPPGEGSTACDYPEDEAYDEFFGTSMAAPHVAGVAALLASLGCERTDTIDIVTSTARDPGDGERGTWDPVYGYGIVDAQAAVEVASALCEDQPFLPEDDPEAPEDDEDDDHGSEEDEGEGSEGDEDEDADDDGDQGSEDGDEDSDEEGSDDSDESDEGDGSDDDGDGDEDHGDEHGDDDSGDGDDEGGRKRDRSQANEGLGAWWGAIRPWGPGPAFRAV